VTDCEAPAEAVIEERVAEIQNLLQEGATWQPSTLRRYARVSSPADRVQPAKIARGETISLHGRSPAEAVIEERVAEIQNLLQEGATWQAVDIWLSEGTDPAR
jgi:hypothetical protein